MDKAKSKTVIVIVGMPGAGKSLASSVAAKRGVPVFVSGDIIRAEAKRRNLTPSKENIGRIMLKIREEEGMGARSEERRVGKGGERRGGWSDAREKEGEV